MQQRGLFITFEGGEGAGKSTQRELMGKYLESKGLTVIMTREPGGTPGAEQLREFLLTPRTEEIPRKSEVLLFFAARLMHVENVIKPHLEKGHVVLCDRFTDSTYAYQAAGRGLKHEQIEQIEQWTLGEFRPDLTLLLDLDCAQGMERIIKRAALDRFEQEKAEFFDRVRTAFLGQLSRNPHRYRLIDAAQPVEAVTADIIKALEWRLVELNRQDILQKA